MATWIDLSGIGIFVDVYKDANKKTGLTLLDIGGVHEVQIKRLGFKPAVGPLSSGVYVRPNTNFTVAMLNAAFGASNVKLVEVDLEDVKRTFSERLREKTAQNANTIFSQQRPIGFNYLGEIVQESVICR